MPCTFLVHFMKIRLLTTIICKGKDVMCGQVWCSILGICALHLTHPSANTLWTTSAAAPGEQLGVRCLAQGSRLSPQSWYWGWRERWTFIPPTYNPCRTWDSNPQPSGYKSDSLTIRPRLPHLAMVAPTQWEKCFSFMFHNRFWKPGLIWHHLLLWDLIYNKHYLASVFWVEERNFSLN